jgi:hypothetical protein
MRLGNSDSYHKRENIDRAYQLVPRIIIIIIMFILAVVIRAVVYAEHPARQGRKGVYTGDW